jgi:hypothetical protein
MLRVTLGCARPDTEWSVKLSRLEFGSNPGSEVQASATGQSRSQGTSRGLGMNTIITAMRSNLEAI